MYIGEYRTQLGEKNRVAIPKRLRASEKNTYVITRGYELCLIVVDEHQWKTLVNTINTNPLLQMDVRDTKRYLLGGAYTFEADSQGRFVLPESLKLFAQVSKEVVFLGVGEWFELWSVEAWEQRLQHLQSNASEIANRLSQ